ncbi:diacylglycerol lipase-alpha isoform X2 [Procambarus clarkii]|uniref:diacylglycerol lipase-alpha isoform X2 n=1 Tax=Procambarus clarkii TaxID=6728 RepID=UPI001E676551|nr:diacylglycerol lipase-alpha-like isoform X2 [Procambarus clarkii]
MPGIVVFRRRWSVGSDDLVVPGVFLFILHTIWLIVLAAIYGAVGTREGPGASCWAELREHVVGYLVILSGCIVVEFCIAHVAMKGTILDPTPRASMQYLLYVRLAVLLAELVWVVLGVVWLSQHYQTCTSKTAKDAILGIVVCNWCVMVSVVLTVWCTFDAAGRSWVKMKRYQRSMRDSHTRFQYRRSGNRNRNWRQRKVLRAYQDSWDHRCRLLFCCMGKSDDTRNSFSDIARLLSEFFRDLDVVPSDVVAGLVLLRKYQKLNREEIVKSSKNDVYEFLSGVPITPRTRFLQLSSLEGKEEFEKIVHYMRFALAIYGWPMFVVANSTFEACRLCPLLRCWQCCSSREGMPEVVEDNCCGCNVAAFMRMAPSEGLDLVYVTYHVDVGETPFFVALDHHRRTIVISIRGTLSMKDVITDLNAESEPLPMDAIKEDWLGHKGMVSAAEYIRRKLREDNILTHAFGFDTSRGTQMYDIVLVGHSLGAGTAAILAILLKQEHPNLSCFAYSPPGGLLSMPAVEYTRAFITSVVVGKDVVPRIGLHQMESMRADLINAIQRSKDPKWKTISSSVTCCGAWEDSGEAEEFNTTRAAMRDHASHPSDASIALTVHQPLYPPGRILHVVRHHPDKRQRWLRRPQPVYQAVWRDNEDFDEVLISPCMIQDHMPDKVLKSLEKVLENPGPTKPQRMSDSPARRKSDAPTPEGETHCLLSSRPATPPTFMQPSSINGSFKATSITSTHTSNAVGGNRLATPPHRLLLETSFTCTPTASPEPPPDLRRHAHIHSPAITWELLSALEEQLLMGIREAGRGLVERGEEDWAAGVAPLASPEALSEASSVVSRASLLLREGRRGSATVANLQQSPLLNHRLPPARLGTGYCFYVETPPMDSRKRLLTTSEQLPESSDDEEIQPRPISPSSFITIEPIIPTPPTLRKNNELQSSNYLNPTPLILSDKQHSTPDFAHEENEATGTVQDKMETVFENIETLSDAEAGLCKRSASARESPDSPRSGPSRTSSGSSQNSQKVKFDLTTSQMSRDSGYGEKLNGFENPSVTGVDWDITSGGWGGHQQEYGRGQSFLVHHYMYSGVSPQLSPSSPANTDSFTSPLTSDPPSSRTASLLPTPVDIPRVTTSMSNPATISSQNPHPLYMATPLLHELSRSPKPITMVGRSPQRAESSV